MNHCPDCGAALRGKCANPKCEKRLPAGSRADRLYCSKACNNAVNNARKSSPFLDINPNAPEELKP